MFYTFSYTPGPGDTEDSPHELKMQLSGGIIHQVDVLFQDGCYHQEYVQIYQDNFQLWPSNRGEKLRGNAVVISFREFFKIPKGDTILTAKIWSDLTADNKEIVINIGVLPEDILMPFSLDKLLKTLGKK